MQIEKRYRFDVPPITVWSHLTNVELLATCIPGCERCLKLDDASYATTVKAKVSFISAEFKGKVIVLSMRPPTSMEVQITGQDAKLGSLMSARGRLEVVPLGSEETEIACQLDASVGGRLGTLGASVIRGKTEEMLDQTIENVKQIMLADSGAEVTE